MSWDSPKLIVGFPKHCSFQKETLQNQANVKIVEGVLKETLKTLIVLNYVDLDEPQDKDEEPAVKNILETFKGKIISRWHNE